MKNTVIIDGNSVAHANHNGRVLSIGDGSFQTQAIYGTIRTVRLIAATYSGWDILVLWDGKAEWRKEIYPEYKANRVATNEKQAASKAAYKAQSPFIQKALSLLGVRQLLVYTHEADDMAGLMSQKISKTGSNVVLVSGDKDWIQLVNQNVIWFDPIRDKKVTHATLFENTGYFTVEAFLDGKALMGDTSDNISGVGGIGEKGAPEFLAMHGSVEAFFENVDSGVIKPSKKAHVNLASKEGRALFRRNKSLMNLLDVPAPSKDAVNVIAPNFSKEGFRTLCEKLAFQSILKNVDEFVEPFVRDDSLPF